MEHKLLCCCRKSSDCKLLGKDRRLELEHKYLKFCHFEILIQFSEVIGKLPWASWGSKKHVGRFVHVSCWFNSKRVLHVSDIDGSANKSLVLILMPFPHVLLQGLHSLHVVTGHNGSGSSICSNEHSGFMHFSFPTAVIFAKLNFVQPEV